MATTIQEQIIREAPEIEAFKIGLLESAKDLADIPVELPVQEIADFSGLQTAAFEDAAREGGVGGFLPILTQGTQNLQAGLGVLPEARTAALGSAALFDPSDLTGFLNPFQQQVIDTTLAELNRQGDIAQNQLAANAVGQGAFGGSRFGVESAELQGRLQDARARALAQLNQQNFAQALQGAQQAFESQQGRQSNLSQLLSGIGQLTAGIGGQQIGAAQAAQTSGLRDIEAKQKLGLQQQQLQQAVFDADKQNREKQLFEPFSRVAFLSDIFKGAPSTQQTLGSAVSPAAPSPSAFQQVAGLGTGLLGTAAAAKNLGGLF